MKNIIIVAWASGVFWASVYFSYLEATHGPTLPRPANIPEPVGSGASWHIVMLLIYAAIIGMVALIPAGLMAMIYRLFRRQT